MRKGFQVDDSHCLGCGGEDTFEVNYYYDGTALG